MTVLSEAVSINPLIERAISSSRLTTYRRAARDDSHAWDLYRWNLDLVAAFAPLSADLEVALRNTGELLLLLDNDGVEGVSVMRAPGLDEAVMYGLG